MALLVDYIQLDKFSPDPVSPEDGDLWYNEATDTVKIRAESITRSLVDEFLFATHSGSLVNPHEVTKTQVGLGSVTDAPQLLRSANDFSLFSEKATVSGTDILLIEDSEDSGNKKKVQIANLPGGGGGDDIKVKVSSNDTNTGFLEDKLTTGSGIALTVLNEGGNEQIQVAASGILEEHKTVRHLIHFIDDGPGGGFASGAYREILPSADPFPTSEIWYESSAKTQKIVELTITRNANKTPATEVWEMYDEDGSTVLTTVTDTISYSGIFETSRTRTIA